MLQYYFKLAWRHFIRNPFYSFINLFGLSLGMTAALLILLLVVNEKSYDRFHENASRIYRMGMDFKRGDTEFKMAICMTPLGPDLIQNYPEVESYTRIADTRNSTLISFGDQKYYEEDLIYADSGFLKVFSFKLIQGDPETALSKPYSMVLSEETARKYFGNEDPVGNMIKMNDEEDFTVTGIIEDCPENSHFSYGLIASFSTFYRGSRADYMDNWVGDINYWAYLLVDENTTEEHLINITNESIERNAGEQLREYGVTMTPVPQTLTEIYLNSDRMGEIGTTSSQAYVSIFLAIAVFILLIASINYMNLSTAWSSSRAREIGLKKVLGALRGGLIRQHLSETLFLSIIALIISILLIELLLPAFNLLMGKQLSFSILGNPLLSMFFLMVAIVVGVLSGTYPAFYVSAFNPLKVLKGQLLSGTVNVVLRNALVIIQFSLAVILIVGSIMIMRQVQFIQNKDLGFNREQVLIIPMRGQSLIEDFERVKDEWINLPFVSGISASQNIPGQMFSGNSYGFSGMETSDKMIMSSIDVDESFLPLYKMKITEGRNFSEEYSTDDMSLIINETNRKFLGIEEPLGVQVNFNGEDGYTIIGVVEDFHYTSLHTKIEPLVISSRPGRYRYLNIRLEGQDIPGYIRTLEQEWQKIDPARPFDYFFLDPLFEEWYENEKRILGLSNYFSLLAIIIALLGLYGLSSFLMLKRTKEVGIRKSLGATGPSISRLFMIDFLKLVLLANLIALPAGYFIMNRWIKGFEYQVDLAIWIFPLALLISVFVASLTVLYHSLRASRTNPVDSLRYE